jgi:hypothetical protein
VSDSFVVDALVLMLRSQWKCDMLLLVSQMTVAGIDLHETEADGVDHCALL